jgi:hypothetical protein
MGMVAASLLIEKNISNTSGATQTYTQNFQPPVGKAWWFKAMSALWHNDTLGGARLLRHVGAVTLSALDISGGPNGVDSKAWAFATNGEYLQHTVTVPNNGFHRCAILATGIQTDV